MDSTKTVLVVEDEEGVRDLVSEVLETSGFNVLQAGNGQEAIDLSNDHSDRIHLMITDVVMPGMSGFELAKVFADQRPEMKVIFMTGYTDDRTIDLKSLDPHTILMQKPFSPSSMLRIVNTVLQ